MAKLKKAAKTALATIIVLGSLLLLGGGSVFAYAYVHQGKTITGVSVGDINASRVTRAKLGTLFDAATSALENQQIILYYQGYTWTPKLADLGISFDVTAATAQGYEYGRSGSLVTDASHIAKATFVGTPLQAPLIVNEETFNHYLDTIRQQTNIDPTNASLIIKGREVTVVEDKNGKELSAPQLLAKLRMTIGHLHSAPIELPVFDAAPDVSIADVTLLRQQVLSAMDKNITLTANGKQYSIPGETLMSAVRVDALPTGPNNILVPQLVFDQATLASVVNASAGELNKTPITRKVQGGTNKVIQEGQDGITIDYDKLGSEILTTLYNGVDSQQALDIPLATAPFTEITIDSPNIPTDAPPAPVATGKAILVVLSKQQLFAYQDGAPVFTDLVSTGIARHPTPPGNYAVLKKIPIKRYEWSYGEGNPDNYDIPNVPWNLNFTDHLYIHDAYWHHNFGHPMSHGCVNMSLEGSKWVYDFSDVGTPVIVQ